MRIIGIDPGLQRTGWGIIDVEGSKLTHISHGVIKGNPKAPMAERLMKIFDDLTQQMGIWQPQEAAYRQRALQPESSPTYGVPGDAR